jgi:phenylpropionate dioxygenase-like ring-hydroxylating dioxygenase large terminal subunit
MRWERERMWPRAWLVAAASVDLQRPGARVPFDLGHESMVLVRGEDGAPRAFYNVCPHRGHRLCDGAADGGATLRCPYHHWTFDLQGRLTQRADPDAFPEGEVRLAALRCEELAGLVWVQMEGRAPPLQAWLGALAAPLLAYGTARMDLATSVSMPVACNWKLMLDANNETYHLQSIHAELLGVVDDTSVVYETHPPHGRMKVPFAQPSGRRDRESLDPMLVGLAREAGIDGAALSAADLRRALIAAARARLAAMRWDTASLDDDQMVDNHMFYLFPNVQLNCYADRLQLFRHRPHPSDPGRMIFDDWVFEPADTAPRRRAAHKQLAPDDSMGPVIDQDLRAVAAVQHGMHSRGFSEPILGEGEAFIRLLHDTLSEWWQRDDQAGSATSLKPRPPPL